MPSPAVAISDPDIFAYREPKAYLRDAFQGLQRQGYSQSLRAISRRFGIRSVATLSMVLSGKRRITGDVAEKLVQILRLKGVQKRYFMTLVELDKASEPHRRAELEDRLLALRQMASGHSLGLKHSHFLSEWHYPALFVMIGQKNFVRDPEILSRRLRRRVSPKQVEEAIANMIAIGLVSEENGKLAHSHGPILKTEEDIKNLSVRKFQRTMIRRALEAIFLPLADREITGLTVGIPRNKLAEFKNRIRHFREELDELACAMGPDDEVFQLNIQFFPLTDNGRACGSGGEDA